MRTLHFPIRTMQSAAVMGYSTLSKFCEYPVSMPPSQQTDRNAVVDLHDALD